CAYAGGSAAKHPQADARPDLPRSLAEAAHRALAHVVNHPGDRSIALDLLAADGLITLALLAQAELAPDGLRRFAASLLDGPVASQ
ncbi:MAG: hypothetical protein H0U85_01290, partial [Gemmatimonadales bacterium]|nr:hypothetical protein [Gemmatimonadales bacterium]